ncbi:hypothetical protein DFH08DRAFT_969696 [Mycena albidolilacea]|uniref:Uncharacterized protein n=1 Tax=Mycena albidolilacea TaxID=1033008 RepID=A0AAD6ZHD0_9AGAR|nr:hypothetical protein DFH08DRAFT_969696 [Mycena albidolilacea]
MKASRGNPGYFHGTPLDFLLKHLPLYLATPSQKKDTNFWRIFNPEWDELYPSLDSTDQEELDSEEKAYGEEKETVREQNTRERKKRGRKAKFVRLPLLGARLCELCVHSILQKLRSWYSNAKTKDNARKVEPFRAWLAKLTAVQGSPRRIHLPWMLWRHVTDGNVLRARYRERYGQDADDKEQDMSAVDEFEKSMVGEDSGQGEGQQSNDRDGEKEGQEKDDAREKEKEDEDGEEEKEDEEDLCDAGR